MPTSPEVDLEPIKTKALEIARKGGAMGEMQVKEEPIAFGLKAVLVLGMYNVEGSDFDALAEEMAKIEDVENATVAQMDLALG